jgi:hypothetical protein
VTVVSCPADCAYLGAEGSVRLAAQRAEEFVPPPPDVVDELLSTIGRTQSPPRLLDDAEPTAQALLQQMAEMSPDMLDDVLWEWLVFGARTEEGHPLLDRMVEKLQRPLTAAELSALEAAHRTQFRVLRLEETLAPRQVRATDVLGDQPLEVHLPETKEPLEMERTLATFLTPTAQGLTVFVGLWLVPEGMEEPTLERLRELHGESALSEAPLSEFLTRCSLVFPMILFEQLSEAELGPEEPDVPPPGLL